MFLESNWTLQLEILELKPEKTVILKIFTIYLLVEHKIEKEKVWVFKPLPNSVCLSVCQI